MNSVNNMKNVQTSSIDDRILFHTNAIRALRGELPLKALPEKLEASYRIGKDILEALGLDPNLRAHSIKFDADLRGVPTATIQAYVCKSDCISLANVIRDDGTIKVEYQNIPDKTTIYTSPTTQGPTPAPAPTNSADAFANALQAITTYAQEMKFSSLVVDARAHHGLRAGDYSIEVSSRSSTDVCLTPSPTVVATPVPASAPAQAKGPAPTPAPTNPPAPTPKALDGGPKEDKVWGPPGYWIGPAPSLFPCDWRQLSNVYIEGLALDISTRPSYVLYRNTSEGREYWFEYFFEGKLYGTILIIRGAKSSDILSNITLQCIASVCFERFRKHRDEVIKCQPNGQSKDKPKDAKGTAQAKNLSYEGTGLEVAEMLDLVPASSKSDGPGVTWTYVVNGKSITTYDYAASTYGDYLTAGLFILHRMGQQLIDECRKVFGPGRLEKASIAGHYSWVNKLVQCSTKGPKA